MSRSTSPRAQLLGSAPLVAILASLALLTLGSAADAGIGNPLKKAKEKLQKAAEKKAGVDTPAEGAGEPVVFDDVVLELTDARLEKILATFRKAAAVSAGRPALVEKRGKLVDERGEIWEKYDDKIMDLQRKRGDIEVCQHDGFNEAQERRTQEYAQRAMTMDPALLEKFKNLAAQNNEAAAAGDSAAQARINKGLAAEMLATPEDSAAVRKKCGPIPALTPQENRLNAIDKEVASIDAQIRKIDEKVAEAQSKEGGLERDQWAMAIERIQMYLQSVGSSGGGGSGSNGGSGSGSGGSGSGGGSGGGASANSPRGFTEEELIALEARIAELRGALGY